jgi:hydrogenase nickel incorporation protein HypB
MTENWALAATSATLCCGSKVDSLLLIENFGNLVCPAGFDLAKAHKAVIFSVSEGEDKPLKYPRMFRVADLMLLSKCGLLPYLEFDADPAVKNARRVNPRIGDQRCRHDGMAGI